MRSLAEIIGGQTELFFYNCGQYRHFMCHIGIFNGITIANTGKYPMVAALDEIRSGHLEGKLYGE